MDNRPALPSQMREQAAQLRGRAFDMYRELVKRYTDEIAHNLISGLGPFYGMTLDEFHTETNALIMTAAALEQAAAKLDKFA